jgi:hypothetical protein
MGRILVFIGIIMMIAGFVAPMLSMGSLFDSFAPILDMATNSDARAAELCKGGESLEQEEGASTYTQGTGYGHTVLYYCVDDEGNRREVTGEFIGEMLGIELDENGEMPTDPDKIMETFMGGDLMSGVSGMIGQSFLFAGLNIVGIILVIIGSFMMRGKRSQMMVMNPYNASFTPMQPVAPSNIGNPVQPNMPNNLTVQLQQLEQAYNQSLITREEYDKARQKLLGG